MTPINEHSNHAKEIVFRPLTSSDHEWVEPLLRAEDSMTSTACFGTLYLWAETYNLTVARMEDRLLTHYNFRDSFFGYPMGRGALAPSIETMMDIAEQHNEPFVMKGVTLQQKTQLEAECPGQFSYSEDRDDFDYIYNLETMASLAGKKLQKRRNMCNRFMSEHSNCHFEVMEPRHFPGCTALLKRWLEDHNDPNDTSQMGEEGAIARAFSHYDQLHLDGGVLVIGGQVVAFAIGETTGEDTFDIHFEKADKEYDGAFCMINREFARYLVQAYPSLKYVNREEDMGLENLRKSKVSYRPEFLLEKYTVKQRVHLSKR